MSKTTQWRSEPIQEVAESIRSLVHSMLLRGIDEQFDRDVMDATNAAMKRSYEKVAEAANKEPHPFKVDEFGGVHMKTTEIDYDALNKDVQKLFKWARECGASNEASHGE